MSLKNLAVNDPTQNQYQLWIVDPERDELPVDGGVFDITRKRWQANHSYSQRVSH
jgi:hypothetical protein